MNREQSDKVRTATILELQRMSTEDGPGLRTTVFFKGCSLRCLWCHNPESLEMTPQLHWLEPRCIGCKLCLDLCPHTALSLAVSGIVIDREKCRGCGTCADQCPSTALELLGRSWTVDALVSEVVKDASYFGETGGVTASGGEAALQAPFVSAFFKELKAHGIHTALDTSGQCSRAHLDMILPYTDLVLYDIKEIDTDRHRQFTGSGNEVILENLRHVAGIIGTRVQPRELWIRTPIIPGSTDRSETITGIGAFIAGYIGDSVARWELCSFNNLCRDKYRRLGMDWAFMEAQLLDRDTMERLAAAARASGVNPDIVRWSGSTSMDDAGHDEGNRKKATQAC
jgi:pyruvate formate lyase activating enzyme